MGRYKVFIKPSAVKELEAIGQKQDRQRIVQRVGALAVEPRPHGCEKLAGHDTRYRVRQGSYRIVYAVNDGEQTVHVVKIGHRKNVYR